MGKEKLEQPLTAQCFAEFCELDEIELPGSMGNPWKDLDDNGKKQVSSQVARRFICFHSISQKLPSVLQNTVFKSEFLPKTIRLRRLA